MDIKINALIEKLNTSCKTAFAAASGACLARNAATIDIDDVMVQLLDEPTNDLALLFDYFRVEAATLRQQLHRQIEQQAASEAAKPVYSQTLLEWLSSAWLVASIDLNEPLIRSGALLGALVRSRQLRQLPPYKDLFADVCYDNLVNDFSSITLGSCEANPAMEKTAGSEPVSDITRYTTNLTAMARQNELPPVFGREQDIRKIIEILARQERNNPILIGEPGVGKTALVKAVAQRIARDEVPGTLQNTVILSVDLSLLHNITKNHNDLEHRLAAIVTHVKNSPYTTVLYLRNAHQLFSYPGHRVHPLIPPLLLGEIRAICATTLLEYQSHFTRDCPLTERFQELTISPATEKDTLSILRGVRDRFEKTHNVFIRDEALRATAHMSSRFLPGRFLPEKALDVLDAACVRVAMNLAGKPAELDRAVSEQAAWEQERDSLNRDQQSGIDVEPGLFNEVDEHLETLVADISQLQDQWKNTLEKAAEVSRLRQEIAAEKDKKIAAEKRQEIENLTGETHRPATPSTAIEVTREVIADVIADWTGIPWDHVVKDESDLLQQMETSIERRLKGQPEAKYVIADEIRKAKINLGRPNAPLATFLLVGPPGVGKSQTAAAVADSLYAADKSLITLDMREFQGNNAETALTGSHSKHSNVVTHGLLAAPLFHNPYSVVLLKNIEHLPPAGLKVLYQIFDHGCFTDAAGRRIDCRHAIFFLTSTLAADVIVKFCQSQPGITRLALTDAIAPQLNKALPNGLLSRLTVVPYRPIDKDGLAAIIETKLSLIGERLKAQYNATFNYNNRIIDLIADSCKLASSGAKQVELIIDQRIVSPLTTELLNSAANHRTVSEIDLSIGSDNQVKVELLN